MRARQVVGIALVCVAAVVASDLLMHSSLLRVLQPRIVEPADGAIVTGPVIVSWEGPQPMQASLTGNSQRVDLGLRESPFEIDSSRFARPGQYGIELRATRLGSLIAAERRFMVRRPRERTATGEASPVEEPRPEPPAESAPVDSSVAQALAERDQLRGEVQVLQGQLTKLREDNADLGQALDELQADTDARLAAADQQREELSREHLLALQENQFLRLRMDNIPACTVWGYIAYLRQINPPSRVVLVSDHSGSVFRSEADCTRARRTDPTGASPCVCVGAVWGGP